MADKRQITTAQDFAKACADAFNESDVISAKSHDAAIKYWCECNIVPAWFWPVYLVASSQFAETDEWIKRTI